MSSFCLWCWCKYLKMPRSQLAVNGLPPLHRQRSLYFVVKNAALKLNCWQCFCCHFLSCCITCGRVATWAIFAVCWWHDNCMTIASKKFHYYHYVFSITMILLIVWENSELLCIPQTEWLLLDGYNAGYDGCWMAGYNSIQDLESLLVKTYFSTVPFLKLIITLYWSTKFWSHLRWPDHHEYGSLSEGFNHAELLLAKVLAVLHQCGISEESSSGAAKCCLFFWL